MSARKHVPLFDEDLWLLPLPSHHTPYTQPLGLPVPSIRAVISINHAERRSVSTRGLDNCLQIQPRPHNTDFHRKHQGQHSNPLSQWRQAFLKKCSRYARFYDSTDQADFWAGTIHGIRASMIKARCSDHKTIFQHMPQMECVYSQWENWFRRSWWIRPCPTIAATKP